MLTEDTKTKETCCGIDLGTLSNEALKADIEHGRSLILFLFLLHTVSFEEAMDVIENIRKERITDMVHELKAQSNDATLANLYDEKLALRKLNLWMKAFPHIEKDELKRYFHANQGIERLFSHRSISLPILVNQLKMFVKGQEEAIRLMAFVGYAHLIRNKLIALDSDYESEKLLKPLTLLIGPTGVGKTYLVETLCEQLNIDYYSLSAATMVSSGYVGTSIDDIFTDAYLKFDQDLERLESCIIYIDEIDKLSTRYMRGKGGDIKTEGLQIEFLRLLSDDGDTFSFPESFDRYSKGKVTVNTANITWILSGAFSGIESMVCRRTNEASVGYRKQGRPTVQSLDRITKADLVSYGLIPEFVGRIDNLVVLRKLTKNELIDILRYAEDGPLSRYLEFLKAHGWHVTISDKFFNEVSDLAMELNNGARGLKDVLNEKLMSVMYTAAEQPDRYIEL